MIGKLTGILDSFATDHLILDVNGVGYVVFCSGKILANLHDLGSEISLKIETIVKEDAITLFGFNTETDKIWFNKLTTIKGVGPKMALAIQSIFTPNDLYSVIINSDKTSLTRVSGVGPRLAERILTEMKNVVVKLPVSEDLPKHAGQSKSITHSSDAVMALCNLGYGQFEAEKMVQKIVGENEEEMELSQIIKIALKESVK